MRILKIGKVPPARAKWLQTCRNCECEFVAATEEAKRIDFSPCITKLVFTCPKCRHEVYHSVVEQDNDWFQTESRHDGGTPKEYIDTQAR